MLIPSVELKYLCRLYCVPEMVGMVIYRLRKLRTILWWLYSEDLNDPEIQRLSEEAASILGVKPFKKIKLCRCVNTFNAAVIGFRCRTVVLTEALLKHLTSDEIKAVFLHEYAHCRLRHQIKLSAITLFMLTAIASIALAALPNIDSLVTALTFAVSVALSYLLTTTTVLFFARRFELEADCLAASKLSAPEIYTNLLAKISYTDDVSKLRTVLRSHPTVRERISKIAVCIN